MLSTVHLDIIACNLLQFAIGKSGKFVAEKNTNC